MTREEFVKMVGGEENAEYAMNIILKNLKPGFITSVLRSEENDVMHQLKEMETEDFIYNCNGSYKVNWGKETYDDTPEATEISRKLYSADRLLYERNRLVYMMAAR